MNVYYTKLVRCLPTHVVLEQPHPNAAEEEE